MPSPSQRTLTVKDPQTGTVVEIPVTNNAIPATYFAKFKIAQTTPPPEKPGDTVPVRLLDPGFKNTAVCNSKISLVDGENSKLYYRGYDIEQLVENSTYLEVSYLLIRGQLPNKAELKEWTQNIMRHTYLHSQIERQMETFRYDAHPMGMMIATIASLSTFHPDSNPAIQRDSMYMLPKIPPGAAPSPSELEQIAIATNNRNKVIFRMLGKIPTIASNVYRHRLGRSYNHPKSNCDNYCENLLYMMDTLNERDYQPDPRLVQILDKMFIVIAEHGVNCSTVMMRHLASSGVDPYTALSGSAGALFGERKSTEVVDMLKKIGKVENIDSFLNSIKLSSRSSILASGETPNSKSSRLMGFGHRIYKNCDPRVKIFKKLTLQLYDILGCSQIARVGIALEEKVLADEWFVSRKLFPNIDFWTALAFYTLDFPSDMFPVWMFIPRVTGFIAHLVESLDDPEYKIFRPRQVYIGSERREYEKLESMELPQTAPMIESLRPQTMRPQSMFGTSLPSRNKEIQFNNAMDEFEKELAEIDFSSQFEDKEAPKQKRRISQWIRNYFSSSDPATNDLVASLQNELCELRLKQEELNAKLLSIVGSPANEIRLQNDLDHKSETIERSRSNSSRVAQVDLLAGSKHARVIAPKK
ncbi:hypothetical protein HDV06_001629 [Boothiomyces sp. JEL0866]|nr:hypothetical protein HDV06_001629 [Boothiomyces sp. JEL0866]